MNSNQIDRATLLALGTGGLAYCLWDGLEGITATRWPSVQGRITTAKMQENPGRWRSWEPKVTYTYEVAGTTYTGSRVWFADGSTYFYSRALAALDRYALGRFVTVRYHPVDPSRSVLEPGIRAPLLWSFAFFTLLVGLGLLGWL